MRIRVMNKKEKLSDTVDLIPKCLGNCYPGSEPVPWLSPGHAYGKTVCKVNTGCMSVLSIYTRICLIKGHTRDHSRGHTNTNIFDKLNMRVDPWKAFCR